MGGGFTSSINRAEGRGDGEVGRLPTPDVLDGLTVPPAVPVDNGTALALTPELVDPDVRSIVAIVGHPPATARALTVGREDDPVQLQLVNLHPESPR
jgi:hypothetical protein